MNDCAKGAGAWQHGQSSETTSTLERVPRAPQSFPGYVSTTDAERIAAPLAAHPTPRAAPAGQAQIETPPGTLVPVRARCVHKRGRGGSESDLSAAGLDRHSPPAEFLQDLESLGVPGATAKLHVHSMAMAQRLILGKFDEEAIAWVSRGLENWSRSNGAVSLERCLRLPSTPAKVGMLLRDHWLARAIQGMPGSSAKARCIELSRALDAFAIRGAWQRWKNLQDPPRDASELDAVLFYVTKAHGGGGLSAKQIYRRLRDTFSPGIVPANCRS